MLLKHLEDLYHALVSLFLDREEFIVLSLLQLLLLGNFHYLVVNDVFHLIQLTVAKVILLFNLVGRLVQLLHVTAKEHGLPRLLSNLLNLHAYIINLLGSTNSFGLSKFHGVEEWECNVLHNLFDIGYLDVVLVLVLEVAASRGLLAF